MRGKTLRVPSSAEIQMTVLHMCILGNGAGLQLDHRTIFLMSHSAGGHVAVEYNKAGSTPHHHHT